MKAKMAAILDGITPKDAAFAKVANEMPDIMRNSNKAAAYLGPDATPEEAHLASVIRSTAQMYYSANKDGTRGHDGYDDELDQDEEVLVPAVPDDGLIDPRITEAVSQFASLSDKAEHDNMASEDMEADGTQDPNQYG